MVNTTFVARPFRHFSCSHVGKNDCKRHIKSKTHKELSALQKSNRSMSSFLTKSSTETDNQRAVNQAEVLMCEFIDIAELNLPITAADTFNKAFKIMLPDSKIAQSPHFSSFSL